MTTARIFDIQRFSIHDGPGIRTTVFFKGCPLRCRWCHNPESQSASADISFDERLCIGCGACLKICASHVHALGGDGRHTIDRTDCRRCGQCATGCPAGALELVGRDATVEGIMATVLRDRPFYEASGGGMTISGGEPTAQVEAAAALLEVARREDISTALDTSGYAPWDRFDCLGPLVDLFLFDLKETDPSRHRDLTGVDNGPILENLRRLHTAGARILLRLPVIPGINDRRDHFAAVAELVKSLPDLDGVELLAYHPLGSGKWTRFGLRQEGGLPAESPTDAVVAGWRRELVGLGVPLVGGAV